MRRVSLTTLLVVIAALVMFGIASANVPKPGIAESGNNSGKNNNATVSFPANSTYNYTYTYFTSNGRQHHFINTYLELYNTKGDVIGVAGLVQMGKHVIIKVNASGLTPGKHGFHIHENPIANGDFSTAGAHFNPTNKQHGHKNPKGYHFGDMPNLVANKDGKIDQAVILEDVSLDQGVSNSIIGRSLIIHAGEDDEKTDPAGNSGDRVAGGNIPK